MVIAMSQNQDTGNNYYYTDCEYDQESKIEQNRWVSGYYDTPYDGCYTDHSDCEYDQEVKIEQNRWDSEYYDTPYDGCYTDHSDCQYDSGLETGCDECGSYYNDLINDKCVRCYRNMFTILEMKTPLPLNIINIIFLKLGVKIDHEKRRREYKSNKLCWSFQKNGTCPSGMVCRFTHLVKIQKLCWKFLHGHCPFGEKCWYFHKSWKVCWQFKKGKKCRFGKKCHYMHTHKRICRYFFQGKCHFGNKCRNYHPKLF